MNEQQQAAERASSQHRVDWSEETIRTIRDALRIIRVDPPPTTFRAFSSVISVAGKTGTAQTHIPDKTHGWFVGFCPAENPQLAAAIIAEHGGTGGELPALIMKSICEYAAAMGLQKRTLNIPEARLQDFSPSSEIAVPNDGSAGAGQQRPAR